LGRFKHDGWYVCRTCQERKPKEQFRAIEKPKEKSPSPRAYFSRRCLECERKSEEAKKASKEMIEWEIAEARREAAERRAARKAEKIENATKEILNDRWERQRAGCREYQERRKLYEKHEMAIAAQKAQEKMDREKRFEERIAAAKKEGISYGLYMSRYYRQQATEGRTGAI